jgi:phosphatidylglycerophosphatase A
VTRQGVLVSAMRTLVTFLATGAYLGYVPLIPGTAGSVLGLILARFLMPVWRAWPASFAMLFILLFVAGCAIAGAAEKLFDRHDASTIVIDEVFGMIAALAFNPTGWLALAVAFVSFRLFDVLKPWPASYFDRMRGGGGVMLDDLAAGIYANLVLQILRRLL